MKGHLFVFEGADGVGKTSIIDLLCAELTKQKIAVKKFGFPGNEAGTIGHLVHQIHNNPDRFNIKSIDPCSLQLMHVATHIESINRDIITALKTNTIVLLDRYWWSTYIYGKISGIELSVLNQMIEIEKHFWKSILPNKLFLVKRLSKPLKDNLDIHKWKSLQEEYNTLSNNQKSYYPIIEIINESTLEIASNTILVEIIKK